MASYYEPGAHNSDTDATGHYHWSGETARVNLRGRNPISSKTYGHYEYHAPLPAASIQPELPVSHETGLDGEGTELQALESQSESIENVTSRTQSSSSLLKASEVHSDAPTTTQRHPRIKRGWHTVRTGYEKRTRRSRFYGWRTGVLYGSLVSALVLLSNIALVCVSQRRSGYDKDGIATLFEGDEDAVVRFNTGAHILINALSTVLLSASNYTMQVLNSPTRHDIDKAHARGKWCDIGLLSLRNMRSIPRRRSMLCLLLAFSSTPLHLFYNASVFKIVRSYAYDVSIVQRDSSAWQQIQNNLDLIRFGVSDWKRIYEGEYVSQYGDLYLVVDSIAFDSSYNGSKGDFSLSKSLPYTVNSRAFTNHTHFVPPSAEGWVPASWLPIDQSLDSPTRIQIGGGYTTNAGRYSRIQIHLYFMIVVLICNLFKLGVMIYTLVDHRSEYLVTTGDAAASFLERPETLTEGQCTLSAEDLLINQGIISEDDDSTTVKVDAWRPGVRKYCSSLGFDKAWSATLSVSCLALVLIILPIQPRNVNFANWKWGSASGGASFEKDQEPTTRATIWNAWLSNMPQVLLSICYFNLNMLCTYMASAKEWNTLGTSRKGLRVTKPSGEQRSTHFLSLPYKWAVPLIVLSGSLHWLLSQSFFLIRVNHYNKDGTLAEWALACGISFSSLVTYFAVAVFLICAFLMLARKTFFTRLPLAESCSLMISAACHPAPDEVDPHLEKVQWGVVPGVKINGRGHCSLSSKPVAEPVAGEVYH